MTNIFRMACLGTLLAGVAFTGGCATECHDEKDPQTGQTHRVCEAENLVRYEGETRTDSKPYDQGDDILIDGVNGNITIEVGSGANVEAIFHTFSYRGNDEADKQAATEDIKNDLITTVTDEGTQILVKAGRNPGSNDGLGADVTVRLPPGYTGGIQIDPGNGFVEGNLGGTQAYTTIHNDAAGDINVDNAAGKLDIIGDFDVIVDVASWSTEDGQVKSTGLLGMVELSLPTSSVGSIQASCTDSECAVFGPSPLPSDWVEDVASNASKTYTFGGGTGGVVTASATGGKDASDVVEGVTIFAR